MKSKMSKIVLAASALFAGFIAPAANAGVIVSPVAVSATNSWPDNTFGNPDNLINHGGLQTNFTSGVTDFATYLASNPQHTIISAGAEWFTNSGISAATLTFNLGSVLVIDTLAAWVDEFWGAGTIEVLLSLDGLSYNSVGSFNPTDWATNVQTYGADTFSFAATSAQYVQLALSNCPQPQSQAGGGCGMGEVAFNAVTGGTVPEPGSLALIGLGLAGAAAVARRRRG